MLYFWSNILFSVKLHAEVIINVSDKNNKVNFILLEKNHIYTYSHWCIKVMTVPQMHFIK